MRTLTLWMVLAASFVLTGCFEIQGVHVLHGYGENDTGSYRIRVNRALAGSNHDLDDLLTQLRRWSRPTVRTDDDNIYIEDTTGTASMERFYKTSTCSSSAQPGYVDCHFAFDVPEELGKLPDWTFDWEVVLQPGMRVLASNHQRTRRDGGYDHLVWYFDGNRTSTASVDFTVRVPRAQ